MMEVIDTEWKESNHEFGNQEERPVELSETNDMSAYQFMEFEFENVDTKITLRGISRMVSTQSSGLALWTCSQILSGYLAENADFVKGKKVLELGSGLGLCGILSYHLGASKVIATDGDLDVLQNLRYNMKQNDIPVHSASVSCPQLIWGQGLQTFQNVYSKQSVILATDVFYAPHLVHPLWHTVDELLEPNGVFLLGFCPHRVTIQEVLDTAEELGYTWTRPNISEGDDNDDDDDDYLFNTSTFGYHVFVFERNNTSNEQ
eukprot:scaffold975_cov90-Cylindrotheca_fusiformis.AAC.1